jgi:hypothetical protein
VSITVSARAQALAAAKDPRPVRAVALSRFMEGIRESVLAELDTWNTERSESPGGNRYPELNYWVQISDDPPLTQSKPPCHIIPSATHPELLI